MIIRNSTWEDCESIFRLYQLVSQTEGGLARKTGEISKGYVEQFTKKALENGVQFVAIDPFQEDKLIGEVHCYKMEPRVFSHVLSDLTIAVDPEYQGHGVGNRLFQTLLDHVTEERNDILRVELIARESNTRALRLYRKLGFQAEGRLEKRIHSIGRLEADIPMAWFNEKFDFTILGNITSLTDLG
jgi:ribosomal protein S18 acetylase RimI-like enzyme